MRKEVAIIGAGIAGVSAAVYAKRAGLDAILFEPGAVGGQLLFMEGIDNYVGIPTGTKGASFAHALEENLKTLAIEVVSEAITDLRLTAEGVNVQSGKTSYEVKSVILATGASFKKLGIPGEAEFAGKGVSYCAICDGFFFKNKEVAVVGGGNTAVEEALYLADICKKVTLIHRRDSLRAMSYLQKELVAKENVDFLYESVIRDVKGNQIVESLTIENGKDATTTSLSVNGLFVAIGIEPNTRLVEGLVTKDETGFIVTDEQMRSSSQLIWACGDCRKRPLKQLVTAAAEGAVASLSVYKHLKGHYISV